MSPNQIVPIGQTRRQRPCGARMTSNQVMPDKSGIHFWTLETKEQSNCRKKNNLKINFFLNTLLFHISIKFFQNLKKEMNSVGTSPMDWFYKEK